MKYKIKNYCDCCNRLTKVRQDKNQGIVCRNCDEFVVKSKTNKIIKFNPDVEFYREFKRAV